MTVSARDARDDYRFGGLCSVDLKCPTVNILVYLYTRSNPDKHIKSCVEGVNLGLSESLWL